MSTDLKVLAGILGNITSSVGIVIVNKYLWQKLNFRFMITLSFFHFAFTAIATRVLLVCGVFHVKATSRSRVLPLALGAVGSVGFMNLNLAYNSVGFYQVSKLMCIPVILALQFLLRGRTASGHVVRALAVILVGVGVATVSDVHLNTTGLVFAAAAVVSTALAQIFTGSLQSDLKLDHMQLLYHSSPLIALGMLVIIPVFDDIAELRAYVFDQQNVTLIFITCVLAVGVNVSNYLVIGRTSPLTYQVVGHLKTCLVLTLGFVIFAYPVSAQNVLGIGLAVGGMMMYYEVKRREGLAKKDDEEEVTESTELLQPVDGKAEV